MNTQSVITVESEGLEIRAELAQVAIRDQVSYNDAVAARVKAKAWLKEADEFFEGMIKPAHASWKAALAAKAKVVEPVEATVADINKALLAWDQEQERIRREEQRRLEQEARERAEAERIAEAERLQAAGASPEALDVFLDEPVRVTEIAVAESTYQKSGAVVYRDNYSAEVTDIKALVKFIAKNPNFIGVLTVNQTALNQLARSLRDTMDFPGVKVVNTKIVASGRG